MSGRVGLTDSQHGAWAPLLEASSALLIRYSPSEMIRQIGTFVAGLQVIKFGAIAETPAQPNAPRASCRVLGPGDLVGIEIFADRAEPLARSVHIALTRVKLHFLDSTTVEHILHNHQELQKSMLRYIASQYLNSRVALDQTESNTQRLVRLLIQLGDACGHQGADGLISLPTSITSRTLADLSGLTMRQLREVRGSFSHLEATVSRIRFDEDELLETANIEDCHASTTAFPS